MAKKVLTGDVVEIPTSKGLAYAQCTHIHPQYGHLIRIIPGFFEHRPDNLEKVVGQQQESFVTFFALQAAVTKKALQIVAHCAVPEHARRLPIFRKRFLDPRTNTSRDWRLWDGETDREWSAGPDTEQQRKMPILAIWGGAPLLIENIEDGWTPERDEELSRIRRLKAAENGVFTAAGNVQRRTASQDPLANARADYQLAQEALRNSGSDLSLPHPIEHFFYLPSKEAAERLAARLRAEKFDVEVRLSASDSRTWLALAKHSLVPSEETLTDIRSSFESLADEFGAEYDGWEAKVTPSKH